MKKLSLLFAALFCLLTANAAAPEKLYLTPNSNWLEKGHDTDPRFAACFMPADKSTQTWENMTKVANTNDVFEVTIPTDKTYTYVIFCRMNGTTTENKWENKYNQTADLNIPTDGTNYYIVTPGTWNNGGGSWSTYGVVTAVTGVTLNKEKLTITPGTYTSLSATIAPASANNKKITWSSSANDVVNVTANGYITALKVGKSTITVTTEDGAKTATCEITVSETAEKGFTVRFTTPEDWGDAYLYAWDASNNYPIGPWPGSKVLTKDDEGYFVTFDTNCKALNMIINNNNDKQTENITNVTTDVCYNVKKDGDKWKAVTCEGTDNSKPQSMSYFLVGYINGQDYNGGDYMFEDGELTTTFTQDSYVVVKDITGDWYLVENDEDATTALPKTFTLKKTDSKKIKVAANIALVFKLVENENNTVALTIAPAPTTPSLLETVEADKQVRKIIENGQIYILRDGVRYNILGAQVK